LIKANLYSPSAAAPAGVPRNHSVRSCPPTSRASLGGGGRLSALHVAGFERVLAAIDTKPGATSPCVNPAAAHARKAKNNAGSMVQQLMSTAKRHLEIDMHPPVFERPDVTP
jgi:hypothetical protein